MSTERADFGTMLANLTRDLDEEEASMPTTTVNDGPISPSAHYRRVTAEAAAPAAPVAPAAAPAPSQTARVAKAQSSVALEQTIVAGVRCYSQRAPADSASRIIRLDPAALADSIRLEKLTLRGDTLDMAPQFDFLGQERGAGSTVFGALVENSNPVVARQFARRYGLARQAAHFRARERDRGREVVRACAQVHFEDAALA